MAEQHDDGSPSTGKEPKKTTRFSRFIIWWRSLPQWKQIIIIGTIAFLTGVLLEILAESYFRREVALFEQDQDKDGLSDRDELLWGTLVRNRDTDADQLTDGEEVYLYNTSPTNPDTDLDSIHDWDEIRLGFDPLDPNTSLTEYGIAVVSERFKDTSEGMIFHNPPTRTMSINSTHDIHLLISPASVPTTTLEPVLSTTFPVTVSVTKASSKITDRMKVVMQSKDPAALSITPLREEQTSITDIEPTSWRWTIKALEEGEHELVLTVAQIIEVDDQERTRVVKEYDYKIYIYASIAERVKRVVEQLPTELIFPALATILAGLLAYTINRIWGLPFLQRNKED